MRGPGTPHEQWTWLRKNDPVHWHHDPHEGVEGFWAITTHEHITYVSRHPELFSSIRPTGPVQPNWRGNMGRSSTRESFIAIPTRRRLTDRA